MPRMTAASAGVCIGSGWFIFIVHHFNNSKNRATPPPKFTAKVHHLNCRPSIVGWGWIDGRDQLATSVSRLAINSALTDSTS